MPAVRRALLAAVAALCLLLAGASQAGAHVRASTAYTTLTSDGDHVAAVLLLDYDVLARAIGYATPELTTSSTAERERVLERERDAVSSYLGQRLTLSLEGSACDPALVGTGVTTRDELPYASVALDFDCHGDRGVYAVHYEVFRPTDGVVDDHTNLVDYSLGGHTDRVVLDTSNQSFTSGDDAVLAGLWRFATMGVEHILSGLDHVLFVLALLIGARSWKSVVAVCSVFTLAHSLTLALAVLGWVHVPPAIVEPLIALSIAYVALDNLLGASSHRLAAVFAFGLLHGLGFAGALSLDGTDLGLFLRSLVSFNVGIELGQAALILAAAPLLYLAREVRVVRPAVAVTTLAIAGVGLFWFVERLVSAGASA